MGQEYWTALWLSQDLAPRIDLGRHARNRVNVGLDEAFTHLFKGRVPPRASLLEIGCGGSVWLPYFANRHHLVVSGIDYSPAGCAQARAALAREGAAGVVVCQDAFSDPGELAERFDVVFSRGVVEHFPETAEAVRAFARYLRPGGLMVTMIPNMRGVPGALQRLLNRAIYEIHVPLGATDLWRVHEEAGLRPIQAGYLLGVNPGVLNQVGVPRHSLRWAVGRLLIAALARIVRPIWWFELRYRPLPPNRFSSPYVVCLAQKP